MRFFKIAAALLLLSMAAGVHAAANQSFCGNPMKVSYGPFDYRKRAEFVENFNIVEGAHFTSDVENGIKGSTSWIGGDLSYTLIVIPNHHRALTTLTKLAVKRKEAEIFNMRYPVECYFDRAVRFAPDDGSAWTAYGTYLYAVNRPEQAFGMFRQAALVEPDNPTINYNLGLAYAKKKDYVHALTHANKAYAQGFPLMGLKNMLVQAGKWVEPTPPPSAATAPVETPAPVAPSDKPAG